MNITRHWLRQEIGHLSLWGRTRWADATCVEGCDHRVEAYGKRISSEELRLLTIEHQIEVLATALPGSSEPKRIPDDV